MNEWNEMLLKLATMRSDLEHVVKYDPSLSTDHQMALYDAVHSLSSASRSIASVSRNETTDGALV